MPSPLTGHDNRTLKTLLVSERNFSHLEAVIERSLVLHEHLAQGVKETSPREPVPEQELPALFERVHPQVDRLLGVHDVPSPKYGYFHWRDHKTEVVGILSGVPFILGLCYETSKAITNINLDTDASHLAADIGKSALYLVATVASAGVGAFLYGMRILRTDYSPLTRRIKLWPGPLEGIESSLSHEYAHHVLHDIFPGAIRSMPYTILNEGVAIAASRHVARTLVDERPAAMLYHLRSSALPELAMAYQWMGKQLHCPTQANLQQFVPQPRRWPMKLQMKYVLGTAVFTLAEARYGTGFYPDLLSGRTSMQELLV